MADYFTNFSLALNLANEAEQAYAPDLAHKAALAQQGDELPSEPGRINDGHVPQQTPGAAEGQRKLEAALAVPQQICYVVR